MWFVWTVMLILVVRKQKVMMMRRRTRMTMMMVAGRAKDTLWLALLWRETTRGYLPHV